MYGGVAVIVKADDIGVALARSSGSSLIKRLARRFGRGLVRSMPVFLNVLGVIGTAAIRIRAQGRAAPKEDRIVAHRRPLAKLEARSLHVVDAVRDKDRPQVASGRLRLLFREPAASGLGFDAYEPALTDNTDVG